ncbi:MAG: hypothetical protein NZ849_10365 [Meiothermus sp.]|uniref:hypothetical protein n=1 Tax=Meiothermus sp. TaxID=1955249 RepID=UPI0025F27C15|nr:hypothetical protein [Meiothermus sp.]MCS7058700.1 hypothetical protein [Meiothermus sp.]MCS7195292.1 hypothetical protein [Meiothermus sp.]MCX7741150.1 hypothetical protein [Meiothermus sp.]MDW8089973.1 hypothetical protein [Meiothermus sp.]MDW8480625.1 hypothetical protein [Meiothermus sp.]
MRRVHLLVLLLAACAPTPLGSAPYYPYDLDEFPVFTSPAGAPLYGLRRYEERRWRTHASALTFGVYFSLELGFPERIAPPFPDALVRCRQGSQHERPAPEVRLEVLSAPPGFGVSLERAVYKLQCGPFERDARGLESFRYRTWLELLYRFEPPAVPGTYALRWLVLEGTRVVAEEERRFTLSEPR